MWGFEVKGFFEEFGGYPRRCPTLPARMGVMNTTINETKRSGVLDLPEVEAWDAAVDGAELLDGLSALLRRHVVLPLWVAETLALWTVHTYAFQLRSVTTYVGVVSPEKRCGKTTLLTLLSKLANRALVAANISPPAMFRVIEKVQPTLLIDEADTFLQGKEELRGILNAGYTQDSAYVVRVASNAVQGSEFSVQGSKGGPPGSGTQDGI